MRKKETFVSAVLRVNNAAAFIGPALQRLVDVMETNFRYYEIVIVDDASTDATRAIIERMQHQARNIQLYCLARRKGDNIALTAGFDHAIGDLIVTLDPRLDPPELIPAMVDLAVGGVEIVYGLPRERVQNQGFYNRIFGWFVIFLAWINKVDVPHEISSYRLVSRAVLNYMLEAADRHRTLLLLPAMSGYLHTSIGYDRLISRSDGPRVRRRQTLLKAIDLVFSTSTRPLRVITVMSLCISVLTLCYAVFILAVVVFKDDVAKGWASLSMQISGMFFVVCIILAVMSEYILQILEATNSHPRYYIASQNHSATMNYAKELNVIETERVGVDGTSTSGASAIGPGAPQPGVQQAIDDREQIQPA
jgi:glycosyltransferase involved in cell wall biosynthesis